jgi:hypothetical protein
MKFDIEFNDLGKKGHVEATRTTLNVFDDKTQTKVPVIRYIIQIPPEKIILHKIVKSEEWFTDSHNPHVPEYMIKRCMVEIEKFEKEKMPKY